MATKSESSIVTKCGLVLDIVSAARRPLGFKDIINQSGLARSSAHRILAILISENLIEYDKANRIYRYGPRLNRWARGAWMRIDLHENSANEMEALSNATKMNSELSVLDGDSVLYLRTMNVFPVSHASHPGDHAPLHCTAAGKVLLAFMPQQQREDMIARLRFERLTEHTILDPLVLAQELDAIRAQGYGLSLQEEFFPVIGIAAPVKDLHGEVIASLSLWTLTDRIDRAEAETLASAVMASAERISRQTGET
ncbi:MAG: IclR family transcriptional regulator [Gammaproteobacteria bacterium]|nr:IclR family transcriptional regulator [Gammaproteobacteria bacterium]